jgi:predicted DNA binding CopG/RHH family protein
MPGPVDKYFDEIKKDNPSYSDEQAWATAWSIYCKYKNPGSEHCQKSPGEYLTKQAQLTIRVARRFLGQI